MTDTRSREELLLETERLGKKLAELEKLVGIAPAEPIENIHLQAAIISNMAEGALLVRASDTTIVYANPMLRDMFGYGKGELIGKHFSILNAEGDIGPEEMTRSIQADLETTGNWSGEIENRKKDGTHFWCNTRVAPFEHPEHGKVWVSIHTDITKRKRAEKEMLSTLKEKDVLLSEVHHRVKNNLQIISSLLKLQSRHVKNKEAVEIFLDCENRIKSMAIVHEKLYRSQSFAGIDLCEYLETLLGELFASYDVDWKRVQFKITTTEEVLLGVDTAMPCALVINELLTNSIKYAFPGDRPGEIKVGLQRLPANEDYEYELTVSDNGIGLPEGLEIEKTDTFGLHLVTNLVKKQLYGKIFNCNAKGACYAIQFNSIRDSAL